MGHDKDTMLRKLDLSKVLPAAWAAKTRDLWNTFLDCFDLANSKETLTETQILDVEVSSFFFLAL